jgi:hypothetical protein
MRDSEIKRYQSLEILMMPKYHSDQIPVLLNILGICFSGMVKFNVVYKYHHYEY